MGYNSQANYQVGSLQRRPRIGKIRVIRAWYKIYRKLKKKDHGHPAFDTLWQVEIVLLGYTCHWGGGPGQGVGVDQ